MKTTTAFGILLLLFLSAAQAAMAQEHIVAHRGYWQKEGSAQNSLAALRHAAGARLYGSEFDVCLTADGVAVVNHDPHINGKKISDSTYAMLKDERLGNGECLPTLRMYLEQGSVLDGLRLVMELKPQPTEEMENRLVDISVAMVDSFGLAGRVDYISFSRNICRRLAAVRPSSTIEYLASDAAPAEVKSWGVNGIDYHFSVIEKKPEWVAEAHSLGMVVNVWTVNDEVKRKLMQSLGVDMITYDVNFYEPFLTAADMPDASLLLPPYPEAGSRAFALDEERYAWGKGMRGTPRGARAEADADISGPEAIFDLFNSVMQTGISLRNTPETATLLLKAYNDVELAVAAAKAVSFRTRPFVYYAEHTSVPADEEKLRNQSAYPSGHTMIGWSLALLLAEIDSDNQSRILERGMEIGNSRVITGYHWQSDVDNARNVASAVVARLHADSAFRSQMDKAKAEFAKLKADRR